MRISSLNALTGWTFLGAKHNSSESAEPKSFKSLIVRKSPNEFTSELVRKNDIGNFVINEPYQQMRRKLEAEAQARLFKGMRKYQDSLDRLRYYRERRVLEFLKDEALNKADSMKQLFFRREIVKDALAVIWQNREAEKAVVDKLFLADVQIKKLVVKLKRIAAQREVERLKVVERERARFDAIKVIELEHAHKIRERWEFELAGVQKARSVLEANVAKEGEWRKQVRGDAAQETEERFVTREIVLGQSLDRVYHHRGVQDQAAARVREQRYVFQQSMERRYNQRYLWDWRRQFNLYLYNNPTVELFMSNERREHPRGSDFKHHHVENTRARVLRMSRAHNNFELLRGWGARHSAGDSMVPRPDERPRTVKNHDWGAGHSVGDARIPRPDERPRTVKNHDWGAGHSVGDARIPRPDERPRTVKNKDWGSGHSVGDAKIVRPDDRPLTVKNKNWGSTHSAGDMEVPTPAEQVEAAWEKKQQLSPQQRSFLDAYSSGKPQFAVRKEHVEPTIELQPSKKKDAA